jgi:nitrate/nitrite-specific signal transduction histidine kinase
MFNAVVARILFFGVLVSVLSVTIIMVFHHSVLHPLCESVELADRMSGSDLRSAVNIRDRLQEEISSLLESLNQMALTSVHLFSVW